MKTLKTVTKILAALAAVAGAVYVLATYGDKIVTWAKKLIASLPCPCCKDVELTVEVTAEEATEAPVEEVAAEEAAEAPAEEAAAEEAAEAPAEEAAVAEESDFEA